jgi:hypothetical protein
MQYYEEEQRFRQPWLWAIVLLGAVPLLVVFVISGYALVEQLLLKEAHGGNPASDTALIGVAASTFVVGGGVILLLYKMKLTTKVDSHRLHIVFSPLRRRDIPLSNIAHWEARTYNPIRDYGGWGIRLGRRGWAYNVSGDQGVELELTNGKKLLIGSQRPEELSAAISRAKTDNDGNPTST